MLDYKSIGRRICSYREKCDLTQSEFSEILGVSESYVSQLERGVTKVSLPRLDEIATVLNVDIALLTSNKIMVGDTVCNSEVFEIIKDWNNDNIELLIGILNSMNQHFNKTDK